MNSYEQNIYYNTNIQTNNKEYKPLNKKDCVFAILFFISAFLLVFLGLWGNLHLGFTISYFVFFGVVSAYIYKKANIFAIICGVLSLASAVTFTLYNDYFINTLMILLMGGLFTIYAMGISDTFSSNQGSFKIIFDAFKGSIVNTVNSFGDITGSINATAKKSKKSFSGLIGVVIAIPILIVIIPLLVSSDEAFAGLIKAIASNCGTILLQLLLAIIITPTIFAFAYDKKNQLHKKSVVSKGNKKSASSSACTAFLTVISIVYIIYLFSQLAYFFSAFKGILPDNYTYTASTYARRGFYEMFAICIINLAVISITTMITDKKSLAIKILSCFISLFSVLMIAIAMQKMRLNVSIYGLSKNRVMVTIFMIMLLVAILFFIIHIFAPKVNYMQPIILICSAFFIAVSFCNIDAQIARYNINAYENGKIDNLDLLAISDLSNSAVPELVNLMNSKDEKISRMATRYVALKYKECTARNISEDIRHFNVANMRADLYVTDTNNELLDNVAKICKSGSYYTYNAEMDEYTVWYDDSDKTEYYTFDQEQSIYVLTKTEVL